MNQLNYQQTQNNFIENHNQTSFNQMQQIGFPQNNIIQDNINTVYYKNIFEELSQSTLATIHYDDLSTKNVCKIYLDVKAMKHFSLN